MYCVKYRNFGDLGFWGSCQLSSKLRVLAPVDGSDVKQLGQVEREFPGRCCGGKGMGGGGWEDGWCVDNE